MKALFYKIFLHFNTVNSDNDGKFRSTTLKIVIGKLTDDS